MGARTEPIEIPPKYRQTTEQGTLSSASLSGNLFASRWLRAILQKTIGTLRAEGLQTHEASRSRSGPSTVPQQEQELAGREDESQRYDGARQSQEARLLDNFFFRFRQGYSKIKLFKD